MRTLLSILLLVSTCSCFMARETNNVPLHEQKLATIVPGETTATDVVDMLGAPNEVVQLARRSAYLYEFDQLKRAGFTIIVITFINVDLRQDRVWVFFGEDDVVTHVGGTFEAEDAKYAMPWWDVYD